jgi:hypothetical protein
MTSLATLATAATAWARCPGDFNLDEATTVDEIVAAVDAALNGCPAPAGCPLRFDQPTAEDEACFFVGRYHPLCGFSDLEAIFVSDGEDVIVSFFDPDVDFFAEVIDEGIAELYAWHEFADPPQEPVAVEGEVLLSDPPRDALTVAPFEVPFTIDDCNFERYEGRFAEHVIFAASSASGSAATTAARRTARGAASKARLRNSSDDASLAKLKREAALRRQRAGYSKTAPRAVSGERPQLKGRR